MAIRKDAVPDQPHESRSLTALIVGWNYFRQAVTFVHEQSVSTNLGSMWKQGFGKTNIFAVTGISIPSDDQAQFVKVVLLANISQFALSILYIAFNNVITSQSVAHEWFRYFHHKRLLRVSSPVGIQKSSYFLSLPWRVGVPLMLLFMLIHWLLSQSVFVIQTTGYGPGPDGPLVKGHNATRIGFSLMGILFTVSLGTIMCLVLIGNSFRSFKDIPSSMPRMATNSAVISACCHPPAEDSEAYLFPVQFGAVQDDGQLRPTLTFSSDVQMECPEDGMEYVQPPSFGSSGDKFDGSDLVSHPRYSQETHKQTRRNRAGMYWATLRAIIKLRLLQRTSTSSWQLENLKESFRP